MLGTYFIRLLTVKSDFVLSMNSLNVFSNFVKTVGNWLIEHKV
jgi:hypothetical protein